jgi:uncharacterized protein YbjT (DUF2867 family)
MKRILITGATGNNGVEVIKNLILSSTVLRGSAAAMPLTYSTIE